MDLNFPLILLTAVTLTGLIVLLDLVLLAPKRRAALANYRNKVPAVTPETTKAFLKEPSLIETAKSIFPILAIVLVVRSFIFEPFKIPSGSMIPTLEIGDYILVNKYTYGLRLPVFGNKIYAMSDPKRGEVMVFKEPKNPKINFIKRVIGLPGDYIRYENKQLFVNEKAVSNTLLEELHDPYDPQYRQAIPYQIFEEKTLEGNSYHIRKDPLLRARLEQNEWVVPKGHYFVMGDNRDRSNDSRYWGFVPDNLVVGKAVYIWMHWPTWFELPSFGNNHSI